MAIDAAVIIEISKHARAFFEYLLGRSNKLAQEEKSALTALYTAINETKIYIGRIRRSRGKVNVTRDNYRDIDTEAYLSRLWTNASIEVQPFGSELAERCLVKGDYWANPDEWTNLEIRKANIAIDDMFKYAKELLKRI